LVSSWVKCLISCPGYSMLAATIFCLPEFGSAFWVTISTGLQGAEVCHGHYRLGLLASAASSRFSQDMHDSLNISSEAS